MTRHRDFDVARAEHVGEPLTFRLAGRDFTIPEVPAGPLLELAASLGTGNIAVRFGSFLFAVLPEDQHETLVAALGEVNVATALDVATWIIEESLNRPLESASDSEPGPSPNGAASKLAAVSEGYHPLS